MLCTLDVGNNKIVEVQTQELTTEIPRSVVSLQLNGNPCTHTAGYRHAVVSALPALMELDCVSVTAVERVASERTVRLKEERVTSGMTPAMPTPRSSHQVSELAQTPRGRDIEAIYSAAMTDATDKLATLQANFTLRAHGAAGALKERQHVHL